MDTAQKLDAESSLLAPGDHEVAAPIVCQMTRFGLRSPRHLWPTYRDYRRVIVDARAKHVPGLLRAAFLIERPATCYSISIWENADAIPIFGSEVPVHVDVGNRIFGRLAIDPDRGPELWSTKWRLQSVSSNLNWDDFDLRRLVSRSGPDRAA